MYREMIKESVIECKKYKGKKNFISKIRSYDT